MNENIVKTISVVTTSIVIFIFTRIRAYLAEVPECACYKKQGKHDSIERLRFITLIMIGVFVVNLVWSLFAPVESGILGIFIAIIYLIYVYNVHDFRHNVALKCDDCADKWPKYAMYGFSLLYAVMFSILLLSSIVLTMTVGTKTGYLPIIIVLFFVGLGAWTFMGGDLNEFVDAAMQFVGFEGFKINKK